MPFYDPLRKVPKNAKLRCLPEDKQQRLWDLCQQFSYEEVAKKIRRWNPSVRAGISSIAHFRTWYAMKRLHQARLATHESLLESFKKNKPDITPEQLRDYGNTTLAVLALKDEDTASWSRIQRLMLAEEKIRLEARRVAVQEATAQARNAIEDEARRLALDPDQTALIIEAVTNRLTGAR